jgi:hypothetical protein
MFWRQRILVLLGCGLILPAVAAWCIASTVNTTSSSMRDRVVAALATGLRDVSISLDTPRTRVIDARGHVFYTPTIVGQPQARFVVLDTMLAQMAQDSSTPLLRVSGLQMSSDYATTVQATATVTYEIYPWLNHTIMVDAAIPVVRYQGPHGPQLDTVRAPGSYLPGDIVRVRVSYQYATDFARIGTYGVHEGGFVVENRTLTEQRDIDTLVRAVNAVPRYASAPDMRCPTQVDDATVALAFSRRTGRSIPAVTDSAGCEGFIIGGPLDNVDLSAYPPLPLGNLWALLNRLAPSGFIPE